MAMTAFECKRCPYTSDEYGDTHTHATEPVLGVLIGRYPSRTMPITQGRIVPTDEQANQIVEELSREQEDTGSA